MRNPKNNSYPRPRKREPKTKPGKSRTCTINLCINDETYESLCYVRRELHVTAEEVLAAGLLQYGT